MMQRIFHQSSLLAVLFLSLSACGQNDCPLTQQMSTQITSGAFKQLEQKDMEFVLNLDPDRLLYFFRQRAGIPQPAGCQPYGGWEMTALRGHTLGHYLTTLSLIHAQEQKIDYSERIDRIVSVLREIQVKTGSGYISAFGEEMLDQVELDGSGWAPYYTLHKILQGLVDAYRYAGNEAALTVAVDFGDYIFFRTSRLTDKALWEKNLDIQEVGGIAEALLNLYRLTGDTKHLRAGQFFQQFDKLLPSAEGKDILNDKRTPNYHHVNTTIPQFIAAEREYELTGNRTLLEAAVNFWDNVVLHRTYCNGSTGYHEHWNEGPDQLSKELDIKAGETCCTNNMIRLSNDLFRFSRQPKYPEYVERATLNHILGSINPENGNLMYFHTQLPGSFKTFGRNEDVFWCCTGTGMENHVRYAQSVFFSDKDTLYVCQFFPACLDWKENQLAFEQITRFPYEDEVCIRITEGRNNAVLKIRKPSWCDDFKVTSNNPGHSIREEDGFCVVKGKFKAGDELRIGVPMHLYLEPLKDAPRTAALFYGPVVLAADLGMDGIDAGRINLTDNFFGEVPDYMCPQYTVPFLTGSMENLDWIRKEEDVLAFHTNATSDGTTIILIPLSEVYKTRFTDYFNFQ